MIYRWLPMIFFLVACSPNTKPPSVDQPKAEVKPEQITKTVPHVSIPKLVSEERDIHLSDIAESITYIPLETVDNYLIGEKGVHIKPAGDYIFINEHGKPVGVFDRSGKFIRTIGKIGQGPGEYIFDYMFWPDNSAKSIYVWDAAKGQILEFSFENEHLLDIKPEYRFGYFVPLGHHHFLSWSFRQHDYNNQFYRIFFHDETGKTYFRVYEPKKEISLQSGIMSPILTPTMDGFLYNNWEDDVIYRVQADSIFTPALTWDLAGLQMPFKPSGDFERYRREKAKYVTDINAVETPSRWLLQYYHKNHLQLGIYEKTDGSCYTVSDPDRKAEAVVNDVDGGPSFWPKWDTDQGKSFIRLINAYEMLECLEHPNISPELKTLIEDLEETSNPVLMMVVLK